MIKVSICITSYNRPNELARLIMSIDCKKHNHELEVIICEDCSPKRNEIICKVEQLKSQMPFIINLHLNETNLGYDRNLGKLKEIANGNYILYMSDDDCFIPGVLDDYFDFLVDNDVHCSFQPFMLEKQAVRKYRKEFFDSNEKTIGSHIYDSILFSGLTFNKNDIKAFNSEPFLNSYYFQVYMFLKVGLKYGIRYFNRELVNCVGDGENGYGLSDSSIKDEDLSNRKSVFSNLKFNEGLIRVIRIVDNEEGTNLIDCFEREYSLRSLHGLLRAKKMGEKIYREYISRIESLDLNLSWIYKVYKICIRIFGVDLTSAIFSLPKSILIMLRNVN